MAYNVHEADVWAPIVTRLADEAAGMLSPARAVAYGNLDPRFYIKVGLLHLNKAPRGLHRDRSCWLHCMSPHPPVCSWLHCGHMSQTLQSSQKY